MRLEYAGVSKNYIKNGIDVEKIPAGIREKRVKAIYAKKPSDMIDWLDLPLVNKNDTDRIIECGEHIAKNFDNFVVLGIGGSALGISMLKDTFVDSLNKDIGINVYVCDNIDSDYFVTLLDSLDIKKTMFNVITKSGGTSETLAQMLLVIDRMKRKKIDWTKHLVVTTTDGNDLWKFAVENNIETFAVPRGVGGRYSVLSPVGLLPAAVMGIDIVGLLEGANKSRVNSAKLDKTNLAYTSAYINYEMLKKGMTNLVVMPYSDRLKLVPDFFAQLWAESLGKKVDRDGNVVYAGQTPIKTRGVTDQHSQLQIYSEGPKDKVIMFVTVDRVSFDEVIESELPFTKHLTGTSLHTLLDHEYHSTAYSLTTLDRPNYTIALDRIDEKTLGEFIFYMEMMTAYMGEMLNIDAYNQPGVELSKIYTKACLKVKGYSEYAKNINNFRKNTSKFTLK